MQVRTLRVARLLVFALLVGGVLPSVQAASLGTGFTYQGQLRDGSVPTNAASCDFQFSLFDAESGGSQIGATETDLAVAVNNGVFTVELNRTNQFGATAFNGSDRWLNVAVRCPAGSGSYGAAFTPRQKLTAAPNALYSKAAGDVACSGCVDAVDVHTGAIGTTQLGDGQITTAKIGDNQVTGGKILDGTVNTADLAPGAVTAAKIAPGSNGQVLTTSGGAAAWAAPASSGWSLTGNSGTTPGTNWLGTNDNQPLELKVNGQRALRLEPPPAANADAVARGSNNVIFGSPWNYVGPTVSNATISGGGISASANVTNTNANQVMADGGTVSGGEHNTASGRRSTVSGGVGNTASDLGSTVSGGEVNTASEWDSTVGGGSLNTASGQQSTVSGGEANTASGLGSTVSGGKYNTASGSESTVAGGHSNQASGNNSTVSGGVLNDASGSESTVAGGNSNEASGDGSTVAGGWVNEASGDGSTVAGGNQNVASGFFSFAAGRRAKATQDGAFVWADSTDADYTSAHPDTFNIRATRGLRLAKNAGSGDIGAAAGQYYRDNATAAWGLISGTDGAIRGSFGVASVTRNGTGVYTVVTRFAAASASLFIPVAVAEVEGTPTSAAAARLLTINIIDSSTFKVYITNGNYAATDNDFTFSVTGRGPE